MVRGDDPDIRLPDPRMIQVRRPSQPPNPGLPERRAIPDDPDDDGQVVRPFVVTGGRTQPVDERLRMETIVTAAPGALSSPLGFERRHIARICQVPLSVAEVAVSLKVPIGVARVLVADMVAERLLVVHAQITPADYPSRELLERIREGVRAL